MHEDGDRTCGGGAFVVSSGKRYHRDPDVDPPTTRLHKFFYGLFRIRQWLRQPFTFTAFKTAAGAVILSTPVYLPSSAEWFINWRGQWALIILMIWMIPSTGMMLLRMLGTVAGGVIGIVVWEIAQGNPYGLAVVMFVILVLLYYALMYRPEVRMFCILTYITMLLVVIYEYQYTVGVQVGDDKVWTVAGKRILLVLIGVFAAGFLSMVPEPNIGRVELRKRLAQTLRDIGRLYGILTSQFIVIDNMNGFHPTKEQIKGFRRMALNIRRQIADERAFLKHARFEPPMRGRFPIERYKVMIEKVDNMADLVADMGFALRELSPIWRQQIASTLITERRDYLASVMTTIKLLSATLAAKMALPPYMIAPGEARNRFVRALDSKIHALPDDLINPSFLRYSTYVVSSGTFVQELSALLETVEDLVGIEDPQEWLRLHV
ncbi:hypothetical protein BJV82DRAFT_506393 [Fennellomyces sp. T-0311]|nr:hypothetical protein BJV82DRAFT_506393 [Fennellomyces sp. T-0311]